MPRALLLSTTHHVSNAEWILFCKRLQPILCQVELYNVVFTVTGLLMVALLLVVATIGNVAMTTCGSLFESYAGLGFFLVGGLMTMVGFDRLTAIVRKSQLLTLRAHTKVHEKRWKDKCGLALTVEYEPFSSHDNLGGFYLYFIPSARLESSIRIRLFDANKPGGFWTPVSLPYLESFRTLPSTLQQMTTVTTTDMELAQLLWTNFWSDLVTQSGHYLQRHRIAKVALVVYLVFVVWYPTLMCYASNVHLVAAMMTLLPLLATFLAIRAQAMPSQGRVLVQRHATELATRGIFVQYKTIYEFSDSGKWLVHCLDAFPISVLETRTGEV
jgi:hypothetical protein